MQMIKSDMFVSPLCQVWPKADRLSSVDVLVIGAGPTGLGAAKRLNQLVRCHELGNRGRDAHLKRRMGHHG